VTVVGRVRIGGGVLSFRLRLTPKGGRDAVDGWTQGADGAAYLKARVAVQPEDGKANTALIALLSKVLGVPKSTIRVASGKTARLKTIEITPATESAAALLEAMETAT
jgi:uncharacterized protein YggU (UPF0235/DUF167 family)